MRAGFGQWDITPPMGVELAGYGYYLGRCAESVHDPLYARALMLETESARSLIICCDLLGLSRQVCDAVIADVARYHIPPEAVIMVSIHTHTGPTIKYHEGCGYVDDDYVARLPEKIIKAVDLAAADLAQVQELRYVHGELTGDYIYNRAAKDGPVDRQLRGFRLLRDGSREIAVVSAACHGVFNGRSKAVSADFSGEYHRLMAQENVCSMYLNGLCGDIDPWKATPQRLEAFARQLADGAHLEGTALPLTLQTGQLPFTLKLMGVHAQDIRDAAALAVQTNGGPDAPASRVALTWEKEMLEKLDSLREEEEVTVKYLLLGGVPVLALPFEGFTQIGEEIRQCIGRQDTLTLGCGEELLGYLPTRDDISRGAYAALESTFLYKRLPVVPGEAERLGEELGAAMARLMT